MEVAAIRDAMQARPFQQFILKLADGQQELVRHPDFIFAPPGARRVVIVRPDNSMAIIEPLLIVSLEFEQSGLAAGPAGDDDTTNGKALDAPA